MNDELQQLLLHRIQVIEDRACREDDPDDHLRQLREASEAISEWHKNNRPRLHPQLNHYLTQASFGKALDFIRQSSTWDTYKLTSPPSISAAADIKK